MDMACLFLCDDLFLGFLAGEIARIDFRTTTLYTPDRIVFANFGYLAGRIAEGFVQPLTEMDLSRIAGEQAHGFLRRSA